MRNLVAKNDFNRAATHKSALDYSRVNSRELMDSCYEELEDWAADWPSMEGDWDVSEDMTKPPPAYNKGGYQYISSEKQAKYIGW